MLPHIQQIASEYKSELRHIYGDDLAGLILFGSYARGDFNEESDIEFAVVLNFKEVDGVKEIYRTANISSSLSAKYNKILSTIHTSITNLKDSVQGTYQNILSEGICI